MALISFAKSVAVALLCFAACSSLSVQASSVQVGAGTPKKPVHVYYSDPIKGSMNGDGSKSRPWGSLSSIVSARLINGQDNASGVVHAGDLIYLMSGYHGSVFLDAYHGSGKYANTDFITIQALSGNVPVLGELMCDAVSKWVFRGLTISQLSPNQYFMLTRFNNCDNILFDSNTVCSIADASKWSPSNWASSAAYFGVYFDGKSSTFTNNTVKNIENGIYVGGDGVIVSSNTVDCFANDGIDFSSNNTIIQYNNVTNHYGQWNDGLHHDAIQGWTVGGIWGSNVVIDSNVIMASTGAYAAIPPLPTGVGDDYMDGIVIFDPPWTNLTITNNVIACCAYHGLSVYGITNSVIANNTVVNQAAKPDLLWVGVFPVSGVPMSNVIVRNNIAHNFQVYHPGAVIDDHNMSFTVGYSNTWSNVPSNVVVSDPTKVFTTYNPSHANFNLGLTKGSPAIGAGTATSAPTLDILKRTRNLLSIDLGAYSYVGN